MLKHFTLVIFTIFVLVGCGKPGSEGTSEGSFSAWNFENAALASYNYTKTAKTKLQEGDKNRELSSESKGKWKFLPGENSGKVELTQTNSYKGQSRESSETFDFSEQGVPEGKAASGQLQTLLWTPKAGPVSVKNLKRKPEDVHTGERKVEILETTQQSGSQIVRAKVSVLLTTTKANGADIDEYRGESEILFDLTKGYLVSGRGTYQSQLRGHKGSQVFDHQQEAEFSIERE